MSKYILKPKPIDVIECQFSPVQALSPNKTEDLQLTRIELEAFKQKGKAYSTSSSSVQSPSRGSHNRAEGYFVERDEPVGSWASSLSNAPSLPGIKQQTEAKLTPLAGAAPLKNPLLERIIAQGKKSPFAKEPIEGAIR